MQEQDIDKMKRIHSQRDWPKYNNLSFKGGRFKRCKLDRKEVVVLNILSNLFRFQFISLYSQQDRLYDKLYLTHEQIQTSPDFLE